MIAWQLNGGSFTASRLIQGQLLRTLLPVLAVALGCIDEFFFWFFFCFFFSLPSSHLFPWVESGVLLDSQKNKAGGKEQNGTVQRVVPLVNCEVDMVMLSSYYSQAT